MNGQAYHAVASCDPVSRFNSTHYRKTFIAVLVLTLHSDPTGKGVLYNELQDLINLIPIRGAVLTARHWNPYMTPSDDYPLHPGRIWPE